MRKLLVLLKKDITIDIKYIIITALLSIGIPMYIAYSFNKSGFQIGVDFACFFLSSFYCFFMALSNLGMIEHKYRGLAYLTLTPITRKDIVLSKYIFAILLFILSLLGYEISFLIVPFVKQLSITTIVSVWISNVLFISFYIPLEFKLGYDNLKYYFTAIIVISPFLMGLLTKYGKISFINNFITGMGSILFLLMLLSFVLLIVSFYSAVYFFSKKEL